MPDVRELDNQVGTESAGGGARTRAFLFADLRGYTSFVDTRGATAGAELLYRYRALVRDAVAKYEGAEIKTEGDSFYVVFSSVSRAVECGLTIVGAAEQATRDHPDQPIRPGVGIHAGETVETPEGFVGSAVNMAARLCSAAGPGEVLVSETVRALTANTSSVRYRPAGRRRLKGIADPVACHQALPAGSPVAASRLRVPALAAAAAIIVLGSAVGAAVIVLPGAFGRETMSPGAQASASMEASAVDASPIAIVVPTFDPESGPPEDWPIELEAGHLYQLTRFHPTITFSVPDDTWRVAHDDPDAFEITRGSSFDEFDGYLSAAYVQVVNKGPCVEADTELIEPTARALIEWFQNHPYVEAGTPRPINISGLPALSIDVSQARLPEVCEADGPIADRVFLFPLGDTSFWLGPDERIRVIVVDVGTAPITFLIGTLDAIKFDEFVVAADAVIRTFEITP